MKFIGYAVAGAFVVYCVTALFLALRESPSAPQRHGFTFGFAVLCGLIYAVIRVTS